MSANQPTVSLVIPTRDRRDFLARILESIRKVDYPRQKCQVIIVDDGSTDNTADLVKEVSLNFPFQISYYYQPSKGIAAARNKGGKRAWGEVMVFLDDDCGFETDWLKKLIEHLNSPEVGAVGGPDREFREASFMARCIDWTITSFMGTGNVRGKKGLRIAKYYPRSYNMAVPRRVFLKVGGFDASLLFGEDVELSYRIKKAGYILRFAPEAFVWHGRRKSLGSFIRQIFIRGSTRVELIKRHRALLELAYLIPVFIVVFIPLLVGFSFFLLLPWRVTIALGVIYLGLLFLDGVRAAKKLGKVKAIPLVAFLLLIQHLTYGIGFLKTLIVPMESKIKMTPER